MEMDAEKEFLKYKESLKFLMRFKGFTRIAGRAEHCLKVNKYATSYYCRELFGSRPNLVFLAAVPFNFHMPALKMHLTLIS